MCKEISPGTEYSVLQNVTIQISHHQPTAGILPKKLLLIRATSGQNCPLSYFTVQAVLTCLNVIWYVAAASDAYSWNRQDTENLTISEPGECTHLQQMEQEGVCKSKELTVYTSP